MRLFKRSPDIFDKIFLVLSLFLIPIIIIDLFFPISSQLRFFFESYYLILWISLVVEFLFRLSRAPSKKNYFWQNWIEVVIIFFPFLRLFRFVRLLEVGFLVVVDYASRKLLSKNHLLSFLNLLIFVVVIVLFFTELILFFESSHPNSSIKTLSDALWWSGISTVGVGGVVPVSFAGKFITIFLMLTGMFTFGIVIANIAAIMAEKAVGKDINIELKTIEKDLDRLEKDIRHDVRTKEESVDKKLEEIQKKVDSLK